jgi:cell division protein FtsQ
MWDNHQMLGLLANALLALAALIAAYFLSKWVINLPALPLKAVSVSSSGSSGYGGHSGHSSHSGRSGASGPNGPSGTNGLKHVTREQVEDTVRGQLMGNFLTVDLEAVRNAFGKLPWVRVAYVRRVWPQSLEVMLEEHVALARWGGAALVSTHGEVFNAASEDQLPLFEGPEESSGEMVRQYRAFSRLLRPLEQNIDYMKLSPRRAWRVRLGDGTMLELGREQMETRLERYVLAHARGTMELGQRLSYVDLRYPNGFAAR